MGGNCRRLGAVATHHHRIAERLPRIQGEIGAALVAVIWIASAKDGVYPLGIEPMFPALAWAGGCWLVGLMSRNRNHQS